MTKEEIRVRFIARIKSEIIQSRSGVQYLSGIEKLEKMVERHKTVNLFVGKMNTILNQIVDSSDYDIKKNKSEFSEFIKPTVEELLKEYLLN